MKHSPDNAARQSLVHSLCQIGAIQFGQFVLKSGQQSSIYINLRKIISYPKKLREIANILWPIINTCQFDVICGVPYTALPIATCLALDHNLPMIMRRKEKKSYGTKQIIEGEFCAGQRCLVIEDVVTTGSSLLETITELEMAGLKVVDLVALIDREQSGRQNLSPRYQLHTMITLSEILQIMKQAEIAQA